MESTPAQIGPYEVVREIARGGMGAVYEVAHPEDPRRLALKLIASRWISDEDLERFEREALLMARVRHPNVLRIFALDRTPSGPYLVCEFVEGETLTSLSRAGLSPGGAARLVADVSRGVAALHEAGILHRDLKPDNVLVRPDGTPVLLDFGVARELDGQSLTQTGALLGTPGFMAPEQVAGVSFRDLGPSVDVYGLGAILYALLAKGRAPFAEGSMAQVLLATAEKPVDMSPAEAPPELQAVCARCLEKSPADRYASAEALADELERFARGELHAPSPLRRGLPVALVLTALLVGLGVAPRLGTERERLAKPPAASSPAPSEAVASPSQGQATFSVPAGVLQLFDAPHPPTQADPNSARVHHTSSEHALWACPHKAELRALRLKDGAWKLESCPLDSAPGKLPIYRAEREEQLPWAPEWGSVGPVRAVTWSAGLTVQHVPHDAPFVNSTREHQLEGASVSSMLHRSRDHVLLVGVHANAKSMPHVVHAYRTSSESKGIGKYSSGRRLFGAPANVRHMAEHQFGTLAAVGQAGTELPFRAWWLNSHGRVSSLWPPEQGEEVLPRADALSVVGRTARGRSFFAYSDVEGGVHLVDWPEQPALTLDRSAYGQPPLRSAEAPDPKDVRLTASAATLPLPAVGLGLVRVASKPERLLLFAAGGPRAGAAGSFLVVWELDPVRARLRELARFHRPRAYTWASSAYEGGWLLLARADCAAEAWNVRKLLEALPARE